MCQSGTVLIDLGRVFVSGRTHSLVRRNKKGKQRMATPGLKDYDREHPPCARSSLGNFSPTSCPPAAPTRKRPLLVLRAGKIIGLAMSGIPLPPRSA
jgi:hypothetical protein